MTGVQTCALPDLFPSHDRNSYGGIHFDLLNLCLEHQYGKDETPMNYIRGSSLSIDSILRKHYEYREKILETISLLIVLSRNKSIEDGDFILNRTKGGECSIDFPNVIDIREMCNDKNELKIAS